MTSFQPKNYSPSLRRLLPEGFKLKKDSRILLCSILHEINEIFVKACLSKNGKYQVISPRTVQEAVKTFIPKDLRKYAFAAGSNELFEYSTGLLKFRPQKPVDVGANEDKLLRKALTRLALAAQPELTLSKKCTTIMGVMKHLMTNFVEETAACINDDNQQSLQNMRHTFQGILGQELFQHAEGHAFKNLEWYSQDLLHYPIKQTPSKESKKISEEEVSEDDKLFIENIQRLAKSKFSKTVPRDAALKMSMTLREVMSEMIKEANQIKSSEEECPSVTAAHMQEILKLMFPQKIYRNALAQARADIMNYQFGFLKYDDGKTVKEVESVEDVVPKKRKIYFRNAVIPLMKELKCTAGKGSVAYVNETLNDIVKALVKKCSKQAKSGVIAEDQVVSAVIELLPGELRNHALSRMMYIKSCLSHPKIKASKHAAKASKQLPKISQELPKSFQQLPKTSEELPRTSQLLPKTSEEVPKTSSLLPNISQLLPRISQMLPSIPQLLPWSSEQLPKTSQELSDDTPLSDRPTSEKLISKPSKDSLQGESDSGISIEKDRVSMENVEDGIKKDDVSMETDAENPADKSSTKMEKPTFPLPSMEDKKEVSGSKLEDHMDAEGKEDEFEDKASTEKGNNDFPSPSEDDLKNVNDNEQLKRKNDEENGMLKHDVGSKSNVNLMDLNGKKTNEDKNENFFLNIPKNSYWLDVRPYEFLR